MEGLLESSAWNGRVPLGEEEFSAPIEEKFSVHSGRAGSLVHSATFCGLSQQDSSYDEKKHLTSSSENPCCERKLALLVPELTRHLLNQSNTLTFSGPPSFRGVLLSGSYEVVANNF
ncbi:hypothetical protein AOLI_G00249410 [Acnodon oligacanthus]